MSKTVRIYPVPGVSIMGVPAIEQDVTEAEAKRLLAYQPPAFTTERPKPAKSTGPADAGPSDSNPEEN